MIVLQTSCFLQWSCQGSPSWRPHTQLQLHVRECYTCQDRPATRVVLLQLVSSVDSRVAHARWVLSQH